MSSDISKRSGSQADSDMVPDQIFDLQQTALVQMLTQSILHLSITSLRKLAESESV